MKMKKTIELNRKFAMGMVLIVLVSITLGAVLVQLRFPQIGKISGQLEDPHEAWSEASYVIWQYNSTPYYACRNMSTLIVDTLDTNKTYVEEMAIGNLTTDGGTIYLKQVTLNTSLTFGSNILIIEDYQGQLTFYRDSQKLREIGDCPTAYSGNFTLTSDTDEHTIIELTPTVTTYLYNFWLDIDALTQNCTLRIYYKIDGSNYREVVPMRLANVDPANQALALKEQIIDADWKITVQSATVEGANRTIYYRYYTETWG
jgi:hypothetical protein